MNKDYTAGGIAWRIWILTSVLFAISFFIFLLQVEPFGVWEAGGFILLVSVLGSFPAFIGMFIFSYLINISGGRWQSKFYKFLLLQFGITICYGILVGIAEVPVTYWLNIERKFIYTTLITAVALFACSATASFTILKIVASYFSDAATAGLSYHEILSSLSKHTSKNNKTMETFDHSHQPQQVPQPQSQSNGLLLKGAITGVLILLMLIPTMFITNIIREREQRQKEVVQEVSSKWARAQTISAPYLVVPYVDTAVTSEGKTVSVTKQLILLANDLDVKALILPEQRPRSIYKVLLYKSDVRLSGTFKPKWPVDINTANIDFTNTKLCFGISDFKGIEEEIQVNFNNKQFSLNPGLPIADINEVGLSVPVSFNLDAINTGIPFSMNVKLKGSEKLHFVPLSANSKFSVASTWPNPSFDGNVLPNNRKVDEKGFLSSWNFNQANLPFGTVLRQGAINTTNLAFGVSMVQPADQYDKTMRSVKYAILFIGLTFALFFIIEIIQRKPFHPVQYALVGIALTIFYTLLLSISEYILFDQAYLIAASATVLLISLYAKGHFGNWKTAAVFFTTLSLLYGFIFILIRLEDTALLVGSIGLFIVLALVMYASRKINWYGSKL